MKNKFTPASIRTTNRVIECLEEFRRAEIAAANKHKTGGEELIKNASYAGLICLALGAAHRELEGKPFKWDEQAEVDQGKRGTTV